MTRDNTGGTYKTGLCLLLLMFCAGFSPAPQQQYEYQDQPLLPDMISELDVEMQARYVRQWREDDAIVLMFSGGFELDFGRRRLTANDAVVWIRSDHSHPLGRKFHELTVYLSEAAEVQEVAGTAIGDNALLVTNLRTFGRIIKQHDAHSPEAMTASDLYQRALAALALRQAGYAEPSEGQADIEVTHPDSALRKDETPDRKLRFRIGFVSSAETPDGDLVQVATQGVYLSLEGGPKAPLLEIIADNAVIFPKRGVNESLLELTGEDQPQKAVEAGEPAGEQPVSPQQPDKQQTATTPPETAAVTPSMSGVARSVRGVYLEGDVLLSLGDRYIRAARLYYDFELKRAVILDAVLRAEIPERGIPLYVRADEIRQLSEGEFSAQNARVSTSEFYTPHYHVGTERVYLRDRTLRNAAGVPSSQIRGSYELHNSTLNVEGGAGCLVALQQRRSRNQRNTHPSLPYSL